MKGDRGERKEEKERIAEKIKSRIWFQMAYISTFSNVMSVSLSSIKR